MKAGGLLHTIQQETRWRFDSVAEGTEMRLAQLTLEQMKGLRRVVPLQCRCVACDTGRSHPS